MYRNCVALAELFLYNVIRSYFMNYMYLIEAFKMIGKATKELFSIGSLIYIDKQIYRYFKLIYILLIKRYLWKKLQFTNFN